jgi:hypothetical protein
MITTTILFLALFSCLAAPEYKSMYIPIPDEINFYNPLVNAVVTTESRWKQTAYNEKEIACSYFQIRPCRVHDFNFRTGKNYNMADMYVFYRAKEVFMYFTKDRDYETIARCWCSGERGTKKASESYWQKVKSKLAIL